MQHTGTGYGGRGIAGNPAGLGDLMGTSNYHEGKQKPPLPCSKTGTISSVHIGWLL